MKNEYIVVDIETTGLYPENAEITEIAGIKIINEEIITCFSSLIKINGHVSKFIEDLTGINDNMLANAPEFNSVFYNFMRCLEIDSNSIIIMHNVEFDYNFINYSINKNKIGSVEWQELICRWSNVKTICSLVLSREILSNESHKLEDLKKLFGIKSKSHRALNDAFVTKKVYEKLLKLKMEKETGKNSGGNYE